MNSGKLRSDDAWEIAMELCAHAHDYLALWHDMQSCGDRSQRHTGNLASPNAVYHHFDLMHLRTAVASEVAVLVNAALSQALSPEQSPEEAIRALIRAYMKFAREQHFLYEALLVPRPASGEDAIGPRRLWLFYVDQVGPVSGPERAPEVAVALWAFMHGMVALQSVDAFNEEKPFASLDFGIHAWMQSASARKPTEPTAVVSRVAAVNEKR